MADLVVARQQGDDFQARLFWMNAVHLLAENSPILKVQYETGPKAFDDVVVVYSTEGARQDHRGRAVLIDHMQCKWHVRPGDFGYEDLTDPKFSGGQSFSILQRALDAQRSRAPEGHGARFHLVTNWNATDPLRKMILQQYNALDSDGIFTGGPNSRSGKLRETWANHLQVDEGELRRLIGTLGLNLRIRSGEDLRDQLNDKFARFGMMQVPAGQAGFHYDDLIKKLHAQGRKEFDRKSFLEMVNEEKLLAGPPAPTIYVVGVRSFMHAIDGIEGRTTANLNLVPAFEGRYLKEEESWDDTVLPSLIAFLLQEAAKGDDIRLVLDAHTSLAYAAGSALDVKSGKTIEIEQRSPTRRYWSADDAPIDPAWPAFNTAIEVVGDGEEVAIAIGITHDIIGEVRSHVAGHIASVGRLVNVTPEGGSSPGAIKSGAHAYLLAEKLSIELRKLGRRALTHIFIAAPNGFTFFLGRHHRVIGKSTLYEYDFEGHRDGGYNPALTVS